MERKPTKGIHGRTPKQEAKFVEGAKNHGGKKVLDAPATVQPDLQFGKGEVFLMDPEMKETMKLK